MRYQLTRTLPYSPRQLFDLVGDVVAYPQFVPWITALRTWNPTTDPQGVDWLDAEAKVAFSVLSERFSTRVRKDPGAMQIDVDLISGPFDKLRNRWRFRDHADGVEVQFDIDFAFKTRLLDGLLEANFDRAVARLMRCFEERAAALYGA